MSGVLPISLSIDSPERLLYAVTPILSEGTGTVEGTGFFFKGRNGEGEWGEMYLITCRHVLIMDNMEFRVRVADDHGRPLSDVETFQISLSEVICPVDGTDLAAFPVRFKELSVACPNKGIFVQTVPDRFYDDAVRTFGGFHTTVLVGFPYGNFDEFNNLPIWRTGATASHPLVNYRGKKIGLNNIDCFPADSGAPVFIVIGTDRPRLLGIHNSGLSSRGVGFNSRLNTEDTKLSETDEVSASTEAEVYLSLGQYIKAELLYKISDINCWNTFESTIDAYESYM